MLLLVYKVREALTWNFFVRYCYVLTMQIFISLNLGYTYIASPTVYLRTQAFNGIFVVLFTILFVLFLGKMAYLFIVKNGHKMALMSYKYGACYENLDYRDNKWSKLVPVFFITRRVTFVTLCLYAGTISYTVKNPERNQAKSAF